MRGSASSSVKRPTQTVGPDGDGGLLRPLGHSGRSSQRFSPRQRTTRQHRMPPHTPDVEMAPSRSEFRRRITRCVLLPQGRVTNAQVNTHPRINPVTFDIPHIAVRRWYRSSYRSSAFGVEAVT